MIEKLHVTNFKCFREKDMDFNRLTILTGANAAGKSSVIQALLLLSHTSEFMVNRGEAWSEESIDVNQVLGIQVGAPNALICQNPTEDEAFDFAFDLRCADISYLAFPLRLNQQMKQKEAYLLLQFLSIRFFTERQI